MSINTETILVIDDKKNIREVLKDFLETEGYMVVTCGTGEEALNLIEENLPDIVLTDFKLPGIDGIELTRKIHVLNSEMPIILFTAYGSISSAVEAIKAGGYDYLTKPLDYDLLKIVLRRALDQKLIKQENLLLKEEVAKRFNLDKLIGKSRAMQKLFSLIKTVAASSSAVLIEGEYGTGKELIAKAIHRYSDRQGKPLITVDCSALPEGLLESELFGYERGAFTGASNRKKGRIELAEGGTVFLDEIGEMSLALQSKLLRVIEEKQLVRLGGLHPISIDFRLITATSRDLKSEVVSGNFRADLFYRLNVIRVKVPALRDRKEDIPLLVDHFLAKFNREEGKSITGVRPDAMNMLLSYNWPGNVRELENCIERMSVICPEKELDTEYLPQEIKETAALHYGSTEKVKVAAAEGIQDMDRCFNIDADSYTYTGSYIDSAGNMHLDRVERETVLKALEKANWNKSKAARLLNIDRKALYNRIKKYNLL
ncbi:MAG: sigma-54-dependent Fis family transcriptional regulator [Spirochaetales bacterium]|nr:sigma-54-dependent Fis family transcriptional regulator [Spirochaetales bacterium]